MIYAGDTLEFCTGFRTVPNPYKSAQIIVKGVKDIQNAFYIVLNSDIFFCQSEFTTLENPPGNFTHLRLSPPPQLCFSLCPALTGAMKAPHPHFCPGRLSVFPTLKSARSKCSVNIKLMTLTFGRKRVSNSSVTDFYIILKVCESLRLFFGVFKHLYYYRAMV